jgi:hypothetical protein
MKTFARFVLILLLIGLPGRAQEKPAPLTVAIFDFQTTGAKLDGKGAEVAVMLNAKLSASPQLALVERAELGKLLNEQSLGVAGLADGATAVRVGQLAGAKVLVTGRLLEVGVNYFVVAKIMGVETSRVFGETATLRDLGTLDTALTDLAQRIEKVIGQQAGVLTAKADGRAATLARLKEMLRNRKLPSVQVRISEQHVGTAVPDPAAEMEFKTVLQQLGFVLVDPKQAGVEPDVLIRGEGFSEFAGRRETLVSCRARLEVEAVRRADGKILHADRETSAAVDVAEQTAGKMALQEAALALLERMIPRMVEGIAQ